MSSGITECIFIGDFSKSIDGWVAFWIALSRSAVSGLSIATDST